MLTILCHFFAFNKNIHILCFDLALPLPNPLTCHEGLALRVAQKHTMMLDPVNRKCGGQEDEANEHLGVD